MDVRVKLLADGVWAAEDDITASLSVEVNSFDQLYLKEWPISLPMVQIGTIKGKMRNEDNWENSTNWDMRFFDEWSIYIVGWLSLPMEK